MTTLRDDPLEFALLNAAVQMMHDGVIGCEYCRDQMFVVPIFTAIELDREQPSTVALRGRLLSIRADFGQRAMVAICGPCSNFQPIGVDID